MARKRRTRTYPKGLKSYKGKSMRPGGGGRFKYLTSHGMSPRLAAYIGRKKYGRKRFAAMSKKGRKRGR